MSYDELTNEEWCLLAEAKLDQLLLKRMENAHRCSICGKDYTGFGNNALPVNRGHCCDHCDETVVIPHRIENLKRGEPVY